MRTRGAKDVNRRHKRKDIGKKREKYAGKKTKPRRKISGKFVPYVSKRRRGDAIKIWFWSVEQMSHQGFMNFSKETRRKMHRYVYGRSRLRIDVEPEDISTIEAIKELALDNLWSGEWLLLIWGHSKNSYHCSARAFAKLIITDHPEGMKCRVIPMIKAGCPVGGIVIDPFFGAGTTGLVALKQNKSFIGIELNPEYIEIANKRLEKWLK